VKTPDSASKGCVFAKSQRIQVVDFSRDFKTNRQILHEKDDYPSMQGPVQAGKAAPHPSMSDG
jgi:hypothetical protein